MCTANNTDVATAYIPVNMKNYKLSQEVVLFVWAFEVSEFDTCDISIHPDRK